MLQISLCLRYKALDPVFGVKPDPRHWYSSGVYILQNIFGREGMWRYEGKAWSEHMEKNEKLHHKQGKTHVYKLQISSLHFYNDSLLQEGRQSCSHCHISRLPININFLIFKIKLNDVECVSMMGKFGSTLHQWWNLYIIGGICLMKCLFLTLIM